MSWGNTSKTKLTQLYTYSVVAWHAQSNKHEIHLSSICSMYMLYGPSLDTPEYGMLFQVTGHTRSENLWPASTTPSDLPAILVNTSPATPEQIACPPGSDSPEIPGEIPTKHFQQSFEALEDLERTPYGPRLQMKCAGNISKALLEDLRGHFTSKGSNIGNVFGYGYLYLREDNEDFVREIVSTALLTVAQKQEIRKALSSLLTDKVHEKYVDFMRV